MPPSSGSNMTDGWSVCCMYAHWLPTKPSLLALEWANRRVGSKALAHLLSNKGRFSLRMTHSFSIQLSSLLALCRTLFYCYTSFDTPTCSWDVPHHPQPISPNRIPTPPVLPVMALERNVFQWCFLPALAGLSPCSCPEECHVSSPLPLGQYVAPAPLILPVLFLYLLQCPTHFTQRCIQHGLLKWWYLTTSLHGITT
jgi:hypothetical protein